MDEEKLNYLGRLTTIINTATRLSCNPCASKTEHDRVRRLAYDAIAVSSAIVDTQAAITYLENDLSTMISRIEWEEED